MVYRFEFVSNEESPKKHMIIMKGRYEEVEEPDVLAKGNKLIVSKYVKEQRRQMQQGDVREGLILAELIKIEASKEKYWDSTLMHSTLQRHNRLELAKYLRAELKKAMGVDEEAKEAEKQEREAQPTFVIREGVEGEFLFSILVAIGNSKLEENSLDSTEDPEDGEKKRTEITQAHREEQKKKRRKLLKLAAERRKSKYSGSAEPGTEAGEEKLRDAAKEALAEAKRGCVLCAT